MDALRVEEESAELSRLAVTREARKWAEIRGRLTDAESILKRRERDRTEARAALERLQALPPPEVSGEAAGGRPGQPEARATRPDRYAPGFEPCRIRGPLFPAPGGARSSLRPPSSAWPKLKRRWGRGSRASGRISAKWPRFWWRSGWILWGTLKPGARLAKARFPKRRRRWG